MTYSQHWLIQGIRDVLQQDRAFIFSVVESLIITKIIGELFFKTSGGAPMFAFWLAGAIIVTGLAVVGCAVFRHFKPRPEDRNLPADFMYTVDVNNVEVGKISNSEYTALLAEVRNDIWLRLHNHFLVIRALTRSLCSYLAVLPALVLCVIVGTWYFAPGDWIAFTAQFSQSTPDQLHDSAGTLITVAGLLYAMTMLFALSTGHRFGWRNVFDERRAELIRRNINCPTIGDVTVYGSLTHNPAMDATA